MHVLINSQFIVDWAPLHLCFKTILAMSSLFPLTLIKYLKGGNKNMQIKSFFPDLHLVLCEPIYGQKKIYVLLCILVLGCSRGLFLHLAFTETKE